VILDTKGNVFGGFSPVKWDLRNRQAKADASLRTFLFTLKNPHNFPARRFGLKVEEKPYAIGCDSGSGPWFNGAILVHDNCDSHASNSGHIGDDYTNDTRLDESMIFTGAQQFQVQEIEIFAITDDATHFQTN
jgi:hypothetical protein